jgi:hypothetical protein
MIEHKNGDDNNKSLEEDIDKDEQKSVDEVNINNNNSPKSIKYNLMESGNLGYK